MILHYLYQVRLLQLVRIVCLTTLFLIFLLAAAADDQHSQPGRDFTAVVVSDLNESYGSTEYSSQVGIVLDYIASLSPDLVLCAGDMVAGQKQNLGEPCLRSMWQAFDAKILQRLQILQIPFAFTFGNHDGSSSANFAHERKIAREFWGKNRPDLCYVDETEYPDCYSFVCADVFFAVIDASAARIEPAHKDWLASQLGSQTAQKARLRVVVGHLPMYALAQGRNQAGDVVSDADALFEVLEKNGADYYISGHHHAFYQSRKGRVRMISAGALGGGPRKLLGSEAPARKTVTTLHLPANGSEFKIITHSVTDGMNLLNTYELPDRLNGFNGISQLYNSAEAFEK